MSKTYKHQATHDYLEGKSIGKQLRGVLRYFKRMNFPQMGRQPSELAQTQE